MLDSPYFRFLEFLDDFPYAYLDLIRENNPEAFTRHRKIDMDHLLLQMFSRKGKTQLMEIIDFYKDMDNDKSVSTETIISGIYNVRIENEILKLSEKQVLYRDQPIQDDQFKPVAFQSEHHFYINKDKLYYEYDGKSFDVDAKMMKRNESFDTFPPFISIEK